MELNAKRCVVTGCASGIGEALVKRLLDEGAQVVGIDRVESSPRFNSPRFASLVADLSELWQVEESYTEAKRRLGGVDLYIANAGQARYGKDTDLSDDDTTLLLNLNTRSVIDALRILRQDHSDEPFVFVAISSAIAKMPLPGYAVYAATKAAVTAYIHAIRHELLPGQNALLVYPVATRTNFFEVSGQTHRSWFTQSPDHVALSIVRGIQANTPEIHPSCLFNILYRFLPFALKIYLVREKNLYTKNIAKR